MGPYLFANAALTGFFLFAAIYHFILWLRTRQNWTLFFIAAVTFLTGINSVSQVAMATAQTTATGQWALDLRINLSVVTVVCVVWLLSHMTGVRARTYLWGFTIIFAGLSLSGLFMPLTGVVTSVDSVITPWGEPLSVLRRESASPLLVPVKPIFSRSRSVRAAKLRHVLDR